MQGCHPSQLQVTGKFRLPAPRSTSRNEETKGFPTITEAQNFDRYRRFHQITLKTLESRYQPPRGMHCSGIDVFWTVH